MRNGAVKLRTPAPNKLQATANDIPNSNTFSAHNMNKLEDSQRLIALTPVHEGKYFCTVSIGDWPKTRRVKYAVKDDKKSYNGNLRSALIRNFECKTGGEKSGR